ncbi:MAG: PQQ-dependent sugar dehydrogenase [Candidatus Bipolaricaulota bacterium]
MRKVKVYLSLALAGFLIVGAAVDVTKAQETETIIEGLDTVWELAWSTDGRLYMTERRGSLLVWDGEETDEIADLPAVERGESGLMGMALDPEFEEEKNVYVCYTRREDGELENVVEKLSLEGERITEREVLLDGMRASSIHNGCRLKFESSEELLVTMGDAGRGGLAQNENSLNGKVLRIDKNGGIPVDNPIPESPVYTLGHRNPQGLDIRPGTGEIYISEHGPAANDEINRLEAGGNYGWPEVGGTEDREGYEPALWDWTPTIAPAGISFLGPDTLYLATLKESKLHKLTLNEAGEITGDEIALSGFGRLRAVTKGPEGECLYISTSNRDGRGSPADEDDRIIRYCPG